MRAEEGDEEAEEESQSTVGRGERQQSDYATPMGSTRRLSPRESPRVGFGPHTVRGDYGSDRSLVDVGREGGSPQTPRARYAATISLASGLHSSQECQQYRCGQAAQRQPRGAGGAAEA